MSGPKTDRAFWSDEDHDVLTLMAKGGAKAREIADALGRTRNAVIGRANRMGVYFVHHFGERRCVR